MADIHCNTAALKLALNKLSGVVDEVVVAGDAVSEYRFSPDVIGMIRRGHFPYVLGNHEMALLGPNGERARSRPDVVQAGVHFMAEQPTRLNLRMAGRTVTIIHASPWPPYDSYLGPDDPLWRRCDELDTDFLITGHTHRPAVRVVGRTTIVNPGSLGDSHVSPGGGSYAILDLASGEVEMVSIASDIR